MTAVIRTFYLIIFCLKNLLLDELDPMYQIRHLLAIQTTVIAPICIFIYVINSLNSWLLLHLKVGLCFALPTLLIYDSSHDDTTV